MFRRLLRLQPKQFSTTSIKRELYLTEIKAYKPAVVQKIEVPTTFKAPAPPVKPVLETAPEVAVEAALAEEAWPELEDPIDNPELYNDEYDISTENDDGSLLPKRLKPVHYH